MQEGPDNPRLTKMQIAGALAASAACFAVLVAGNAMGKAPVGYRIWMGAMIGLYATIRATAWIAKRRASSHSPH